MPILKIFTNVPKSHISNDFMMKVIPVLVDGVKKEADKFTCMVQSDCLLTIDGDSTSPAATASLESIGHLGPEENKRIVQLLSTVIQNELGVKPGRYIPRYSTCGCRIHCGCAFEHTYPIHQLSTVVPIFFDAGKCVHASFPVATQTELSGLWEGMWDSPAEEDKTEIPTKTSDAPSRRLLAWSREHVSNHLRLILRPSSASSPFHKRRRTVVPVTQATFTLELGYDFFSRSTISSHITLQKKALQLRLLNFEIKSH